MGGGRLALYQIKEETRSQTHDQGQCCIKCGNKSTVGHARLFCHSPRITHYSTDLITEKIHKRCLQGRTDIIEQNHSKSKKINNMTEIFWHNHVTAEHTWAFHFYGSFCGSELFCATFLI